MRARGKGEGTTKWDFVTGKNQDWDPTGHQVASLQEMATFNLTRLKSFYLVFYLIYNIFSFNG